MVPSEQIRKAIRKALSKERVGVRRFEIAHGLRRWCLRGLLDPNRPQIPSVDRAAEICDALGLELYVGPPRKITSTPMAEQTAQDTAGMRNSIVEELRSALNRITGTLDQDYVEVPVYSEEITESSEYLNRAIECRFPYRKNWLTRYGVAPDRCFMVRLLGWSMAPTLPDKCFVLVNAASTELRDKAVFLVKHHGRIMARRSEKDKRAGWMLSSDSELNSKQRWKPDDRVFGEIVWMAHHVRIRVQPVSIEVPVVDNRSTRQTSFPPIPSPHIHHPR